VSDLRLGKIKPPYGGFERCADDACRKVLAEPEGAYLFTALETGKMIVVCFDTAIMLELLHTDRFRLVAL